MLEYLALYLSKGAILMTGACYNESSGGGQYWQLETWRGDAGCTPRQNPHTE